MKHVKKGFKESRKKVRREGNSEGRVKEVSYDKGGSRGSSVTAIIMVLRILELGEAKFRG